MKRKNKILPNSWFARDAVVVARDLLGKVVTYGECSGIIVETEAYTIDAASHGRVLTERSRLMHETYGHWYVYFTYGMHYCANVTTNKDDVGAVLIRAVEPIRGIELMKKRRKTDDIRKLCSGPARFAQAFGISKSENGLSVKDSFAIFDAPDVPEEQVAASTRIGIRADVDLPWRFTVFGSTYVSQ